MKLINVLETLLLEATPEEIYNKYYNDIPFDTFKKIVSSDPASKLSGDRIDKIGPYSKILLNIFRNGNMKMEDLPKATEYLTYVYKHKVSLDIKNIQTIADIFPYISKHYVKNTVDLSTIIRSLSPNEYEKVFEGNEWTILIPKTEKAACYLGVNTQWCTTWGPLSLNPNFRGRTNRFRQYNQSGPLYIIINNSDLNEKYQFHFPTDQFMDVNDKQINVNWLFANGPEIKYFFFPSLLKESVDIKEISEEIARMYVLNDKDIETLMSKISSESANELVVAIQTKNYEKIKELIQTETNGIQTVPEIEGGRILFTYQRLNGDLDSVDNILSQYKRERRESYDFVYNDFSDINNKYLGENYLKPLFEEYYNENKNDIYQKFGTNTYERFYDLLFDNFVNNEKIRGKYIDKYCDLNAPNFEGRMQEEIEKIERYIIFDSGYYSTLKVNIGYFLKYIIENNITKIENITDFFDGFIYYYDIPTDYGDEFYDWERTLPSYNDIEFDIDVFFKYLSEDEFSQKCIKLRMDLNKIIDKLMKGSTTFENDEFKIEIPNKEVDCEKESVFVNYLNKKTNEKNDGLVRIENLPQYLTRYKLFESVMKFKRFL